MKFDDITKRLSGKQQLKEAKTNEDLDKPRTSDKVLLTDDQLGSVAGGGPGSQGRWRSGINETGNRPLLHESRTLLRLKPTA